MRSGCPIHARPLRMCGSHSDQGYLIRAGCPIHARFMRMCGIGATTGGIRAEGASCKSLGRSPGHTSNPRMRAVSPRYRCGATFQSRWIGWIQVAAERPHNAGLQPASVVPIPILGRCPRLLQRGPTARLGERHERVRVPHPCAAHAHVREPPRFGIPISPGAPSCAARAHVWDPLRSGRPILRRVPIHARPLRMCGIGTTTGGIRAEGASCISLGQRPRSHVQSADAGSKPALSLRSNVPVDMDRLDPGAGPRYRCGRNVPLALKPAQSGYVPKILSSPKSCNLHISHDI